MRDVTSVPGQGVSYTGKIWLVEVLRNFSYRNWKQGVYEHYTPGIYRYTPKSEWDTKPVLQPSSLADRSGFYRPFAYSDYTEGTGGTFSFERLATGRSEVTPSDGERPTYYRAYDIKREVSFDEPRWKVWLTKSDYKTLEARVNASSVDFPPIPSYLNSEYKPSVNPLWVNASTNAALEKAADRRVQMAVTLAEAGETFNLISSGITRAFRFIRYLRKGNVRMARQMLPRDSKEFVSTISNSTLAYQLGIKPLVSDVVSYIDLLEEKLRRKAEHTVRSTKTWEIPGGHVDITTSLTFQVVDANLDALTSLGLDNPLSVAWELVPYSFVVDWFVNVGSALSNLTSSVGLALKHGYTTTCVVYDHEGSSVFAFERTPHYSFPPAQVSLGRGIHSHNRAVTATALMGSLATRR